MDLLDNLALGFQTAFSLQNLLYALFGCLLGTLIGILPGLGPLATISMLLPFTFGLEPVAALIMLSGIYYGAAYGGSTTSILLNVPGESSSAVTAIDGYQMAKRGRAGAAIAIAAIGSFFAGCVGTLVIALVSEPLAELAFRFGSAEYFSLMVLGLIGAVSLSSGPIFVALGMIIFGTILGTVGMDISSGYQRFTFGFSGLWEGIDFLVLAVGFFALGEILASLSSDSNSPSMTRSIEGLFPTREDFKRATPAVLRGTLLGSVLGVLPGAGMTLASFFSYSLEKKVSRYSSEMGTGAIEGVAGPESANNAAAQTAFIPTLTLGIPGSATMALMLGAMVMHDIQPGPRVMTTNPELFWGLIVSMWVGNLMLVVLNLPLVGVWVKLLTIPYKVLYPAILLFSCIGVFATNLSAFDVYLAAIAGGVGYFFKKMDCEPAPLILGFVLGPLLEQNFKRALVLSEGSFWPFVQSPISLTFLSLAVIVAVLSSLPSIRKRKDAIIAEDD